MLPIVVQSYYLADWELSRRAHFHGLDLAINDIGDIREQAARLDRRNPDEAFSRSFATLLIVLLAFLGCASYSAAQSTVAATVTLSPATPTYADTTTVTVTLTGSGGPAPTGTISYTVDGGTAQSAAVMSINISAVAYLDVAPQIPGAHSLSISYSGDGNYAAFSGQTQSFSVTDLPMAVVASTYALIPYVSSVFQGSSYSAVGLQGVSVDKNKNVYLAYGHASVGNSQAVAPAIAEITAAATYVSLPVSGLGVDAQLAVDGAGNLYIADRSNSRVVEYSTSGVQTNLPLTGLMQPGSITYDAASGSLFILDTGLGGVIQYTLSTQSQSTVFSGVASLNTAIATDGQGGVYYAVGDMLFYRTFSGTTTPIFGEFGYSSFDYVGGNIQSLAFDPSTQKLWIAISTLTNPNTALLVLDKLHHSTQVSGGLLRPITQVALDSTGKAYTAASVITLGRAANVGPGIFGPFIDTNAPAYAVITLPQGYVMRVGARGATNFETLTAPNGYPVGFGANSWPYTVDLGAGFKITFPVYGVGLSQSLVSTPGSVSTLPLTFAQAGGIAYISPYFGFGDTIYVSDKTNNSVSSVLYQGQSDGTTYVPSPPQTLAFTGLVQPTQLAADGAGDVWVMDQGAAAGGTRIVLLGNNGVQTVPYSAATGDPAGLLSSVSAFAVDGATNLFLGGSKGSGGVIVKIDTFGAETQIASSIAVPAAMAIDSAGDVISADASTGTLIKVDPLGTISTISTGLPPASEISLDPSGTVYLSSASETSVLMITPNGTQTSIAIPGAASPGLALVDDIGTIHVADSATRAMYVDYRNVSATAFGKVPVNTIVTHNYTITNVGNLTAPSFTPSGSAGSGSYNPFSIAAGATNGCQLSGSASPTSLTPGQSCQVQMQYAPTKVESDLGTFYLASQFSFSSGFTASTQTFHVSGSGTSAASAPIPSLTPPALDFGSLAVGITSAAKVAMLSNTGNAALTISSLGFFGSNTSSFGETTTCGTTLAAGASCSIAITCTPSTTGSLAASLSANFPSPIPQQSIALTCTGTSAATPQASLTPTTANFSNVTTGTTSAAQAFTLTNAGNAALAISSISLGRANASAFAIASNTCGTSLAAGASCIISVTFTPTAVGSAMATLNVSDYASNLFQTSSLTGIGTQVAAPQAALTPATANFGSVITGTTSAAQAFTLTNAGNAALAIGSVSLTGANASVFAMVSNTCGTSLAASSSCIISVAFAPTATGSAAATLSVADSASSSPQTSSLMGIGTAPPTVADFNMTATPASQSVTSGSSATYTVSIGSTGGTFAQAILLTASGLPLGATVTFSPASVTPGSSGAQSTMTVHTVVQHAAGRDGLPQWPFAAPVLAALLLIFPDKRFRLGQKSRRVLMSLACIVVLLAVAVSTIGCGAGFALPSSAKTYTITVTGTSGADTHSTTVTLTVQ